MTRKITTYPINEDMAGLVPMASDAQQVSMNEDILANGLRDPIVLWRGEIIDGRCRQKACEFAGERIRTKEIDAETSEADVRILVKSLNTRRNLDPQQLIMSCAYDTINNKKPVLATARAWAVGKTLVNNARKIIELRPDIAKKLFDGIAVPIVDGRGNSVDTKKVSAVYAWVIRYNEGMEGVHDKGVEDHGWAENGYIKTMTAKDFYYGQLDLHSIGEVPLLRLMIADYANLKFPPIKTSEADNIDNYRDPQDANEVKDIETPAEPTMSTPEEFMKTLQTTYTRELFNKKVEEGKDNALMRSMISKMDRPIDKKVSGEVDLNSEEYSEVSI